MHISSCLSGMLSILRTYIQGYVHTSKFLHHWIKHGSAACMPRNASNTTSLTIVSMYLTYTLTIIFQQHSNVRNAFPIHPLAHNLDNTQDTLLSWIPLFTSLSSKHLDTILVRAYTCLTKFCTACHSRSPTQRPSSKKSVTAEHIPHSHVRSAMSGT